jgi:hypothetical protein
VPSQSRPVVEDLGLRPTIYILTRDMGLRHILPPFRRDFDGRRIRENIGSMGSHLITSNSRSRNIIMMPIVALRRSELCLSAKGSAVDRSCLEGCGFSSLNL